MTISYAVNLGPQAPHGYEQFNQLTSHLAGIENITIYSKVSEYRKYNILLLIDRAIRRNWVMLDSLVEKYRMTQ